MFSFAPELHGPHEAQTEEQLVGILILDVWSPFSGETLPAPPSLPCPPREARKSV